jgi:hypothetical protein
VRFYTRYIVICEIRIYSLSFDKPVPALGQKKTTPSLERSLIFSKWYARRDLNPRPSGSKPDALSTELRAH